jgi:SHS2 domain-containing protein
VVPFEILEHPADIGFRAFGRTLPEVFENAALAMLSIRADVDDVEPRHEFPIAATGADFESLLVNFLSEALYLVDGTQTAFRRVRVDSLSETAIAATGLGEPHEHARHHVKLIVKAVTWHQLRIEKTAEGYSAQVYLDI